MKLVQQYSFHMQSDINVRVPSDNKKQITNR